MPSRSRPALAMAVLAAALGLVVMAGWFAENRRIVQVHPDFVQMQFNAAFCFFALGVALAFFAFRRRPIVHFFAVPVLLIALLTIAEYAFTIDIGIDQLIVRDTLGLVLDHPGRMPLQAAIAFLLSSLVLMLAIAFPTDKCAPFSVAAVGLAVMTQGLLMVGAYLVEHKTPLLFGTGMAFHASLGFVALGLGVATCNFREGYIPCLLRSRCLPVFIMLPLFVLILNIRQGLEASERELVHRITETNANNTRQQIFVQVNAEVLALQRMSQRWNSRRPEQGEWESDASMYMAHHPCMRSFAWIDASLTEHWRISARGSSDTAGGARTPSAALIQELKQMRGTRTARIVTSRVLGSDTPPYMTIVPLVIKEVPDGFLIVTSDLQTVFGEVVAAMPEDLALNYSVSIFDGPTQLYRSYAPDDAAAADWAHETSLTLHEASWTVRLVPTLKAIDARHKPLSGVVLSAGIIMSVLLALVTWMSQSMRRRAERIQETYEQLRAQGAKRKIAEEARNHATTELAASEEKYRKLVEHLPVGVYSRTCGEENRLLHANPCLLEIFGYTMEELTALGSGPSYVVPAERQKLNDALLRFGRVDGMEVRLRRKNGTEFWARIWATLTRDADGRPKMTEGILVDVTELKRTWQALLQNEKLAALGRMSAGIAHELIQPIHIIKGLCQGVVLNIDEKIPMTEEEIRQNLVDAGQQIDRMDEILRNMKNFAATGLDANIAPLDVNRLVNYSLNVLQQQRMEREGIAMRFVPFAEPLLVRGNEQRLQQVMANLILNAIDAVLEKSAGGVTSENHIEIRARPSRDSLYALIEIENSGVGIQTENMDKIFEPFFTTKGPDKGTGLGLSICRDIVRQHGGEITVCSNPGQGTTFSISLPRVLDTASESMAAAGEGT